MSRSPARGAEGRRVTAMPLREASSAVIVSSASARGWGVYGALATLAAALPMLVGGFVMAVRHPNFIFDGDFAVDEIALIRAVHFTQLVGNYSRFGWDHPGPAWFYALAIVYAPLGGQSWSFVVANLAVDAVLGCLIVAAAWRIRGPMFAAITAIFFLWFVSKIGAPTLTATWPPFATILPMILFLLLAAFGAAGSLPAALGALLVGSYEAQLHVGTVPLVGIELGVMVLVALVTGAWRPLGRWLDWREHRGAVLLLTAGLLLLLLMWLPVAIDELTGRPGNLTKLANFFFFAHLPHHRLREGVSALGRLLVVFPFGHVPAGAEADFATLSLKRVLVVGAFFTLSAALALAGQLLRDRFARATGLLLAVATVALVWSISRVVGDLFTYFLYWVMVLPLVLLVGWTALAAGVWPRLQRRLPRALRRQGPLAIAAAAALAVIVASAVETSAFVQPAAPIVADTSGQTAAALTQAVLSNEAPTSTLVDITTLDAWPAAAGVTLQLVKRGWPVAVRPEWEFMFGNQMHASGHERLQLVFVAVNLNNFDSTAPGVRLLGVVQVACPLRGSNCPVYLFSRPGS